MSGPWNPSISRKNYMFSFQLHPETRAKSPTVTVEKVLSNKLEESPDASTRSVLVTWGSDSGKGMSPSQSPSRHCSPQSSIHEDRLQKSLVLSPSVALLMLFLVPNTTFLAFTRLAPSHVWDFSSNASSLKKAFLHYPIIVTYLSYCLSQQPCSHPSLMLSHPLLVLFIICFPTGPHAPEGTDCLDFTEQFLVTILLGGQERLADWTCSGAARPNRTFRRDGNEFYDVLSNMVASTHAWPLRTWNVAIANEALNF